MAAFAPSLPLLPLRLLEGMLLWRARGGLFACQKHIKIIGNDNLAKWQNIFKLTESNRKTKL